MLSVVVMLSSHSYSTVRWGCLGPAFLRVEESGSWLSWKHLGWEGSIAGGRGLCSR